MMDKVAVETGIAVKYKPKIKQTKHTHTSKLAVTPGTTIKIEDGAIHRPQG